MAIKYPVTVRELDTTYENRMGGWVVISKDGTPICDKEHQSDASTIADSLNAVHEFPVMSDDPENLIKWFNKYRHILERDDG